MKEFVSTVANVMPVWRDCATKFNTEFRSKLLSVQSQTTLLKICEELFLHRESE